MLQIHLTWSSNLGLGTVLNICQPAIELNHIIRYFDSYIDTDIIGISFQHLIVLTNSWLYSCSRVNIYPISV